MLSIARQLRRLAVDLPRTLIIVWHGAGSLSLIWSSLLIIQGLLPPLSLYLVRSLVDQLVAAVNADGRQADLHPLLLTAGLLAAMMVAGELLNSLSDWINVAQSEFISDHVRTLIHKKSTQIDVMFYELPYYHDQLERARNQASSRPLALLQNFGNLFRDIISIFGVGVVLLQYSFWLPLGLLFSTLPAFLVVVYFNRLNHRWWEETTTERRWASYYDGLLTGAAFASELRIFGLGDRFQSAYRGIRRKLRNELLRLTKYQSLSRLGAQLFTLFLFVVIMAWMAWRALQGMGTIGDVALLFQAFNQAQRIVGSLLRNVGRLYTDSLFLENLFEFLNLQPTIVEPSNPEPAPEKLVHGIQFQDVMFLYPGAKRPVFDKFNLLIPAGKIIAIVGPNGAGKSTLLKLLCRLYDPTAGNITFDGTNIRQMEMSKLRRLITVIFQHPVSYSATVAQNIMLGDVTAELAPAEIETIAQSAGAHQFIMHLPQGYDTLLGKLFAGGNELSGGEWQRLALARAFVRRAQILILDEPTSALDSWSERDWFERLRQLAVGRTVILITHRFTIAKDADFIHVMDQGEIVESGTHEELLAKHGQYARSWQAQIQKVSTLAPDWPETPGAGAGNGRNGQRNATL